MNHYQQPKYLHAYSEISGFSIMPAKFPLLPFALILTFVKGRKKSLPMSITVVKTLSHDGQCSSLVILTPKISVICEST